MDDETTNRFFEPFFTTKFQGRGLGMAAAYGIVKNHNGWISVNSELGKGTTVSILLPSIGDNVKKEKKPSAQTIKGSGTILLIDDDEMVMEVNRNILEKFGYCIFEARTGKEALDIAKSFDGDINLALLDIHLPDIDGKAIYPLLIKARPKIKVLVCSGYSLDGPAQDILNAGAHGFIHKPFTVRELSQEIKKVL